MTEKIHEPLASRYKFFLRLIRSIAMALLIIVIALSVGMVGYHVFENMSWINAFANAAMILSGMGPLTPLNTSAGKLFAGSYALFSGLVFIVIIGIVFAPIVHRFLHRFHLGN